MPGCQGATVLGLPQEAMAGAVADLLRPHPIFGMAMRRPNTRCREGGAGEAVTTFLHVQLGADSFLARWPRTDPNVRFSGHFSLAQHIPASQASQACQAADFADVQPCSPAHACHAGHATPSDFSLSLPPTWRAIGDQGDLGRPGANQRALVVHPRRAIAGLKLSGLHARQQTCMQRPLEMPCPSYGCNLMQVEGMGREPAIRGQRRKEWGCRRLKRGVLGSLLRQYRLSYLVLGRHGVCGMVLLFVQNWSLDDTCRTCKGALASLD